MVNTSLINDVVSESTNRRSLLKKIGIASAAVGAAAVAGGVKLNAQSSGPTVVDVLQFALNLEYLEAEFYTYATTGKGIEAMGIGIDGAGTPGPTTGASKVNFANNLVFTGAIAANIAQDERAHVMLLRGALTQAGITPVAKPAINLNALGIGFANEAQFLTLARVFEEIGVSAYGGAAALPVVGNSPYIGTAARILATEAEHTGNIRLQIARLGIQAAPIDGVDIIPPPSGSDFISADPTMGLTAVRTPGQVLFLAYGNMGNATAGGFYPNGVNGAIKMSDAKSA
ncbi:MAG TPA: ferritin-like domain-containing protein [Bryobacteraceae bacterium]